MAAASFGHLAPLAVVLVGLPALFGCAAIPSGRAATDRVEIGGNASVPSSEIEDKLATTASPKFLGLWSGVVFDYELFDRFVLERDLERVERFYRARGFYEAHARAGRVVYTSANHVAVTIVVDEGRDVRVGTVVFDGLESLPDRVASAVRAAEGARVAPGERFDEGAFADAGAAMTRALTDRGYAYAVIKRSARVDLVRHKADVSFDVVPNISARLGAITLEGLGSLPEEPVRRALNLSEGEVYSTRSLESAQKALIDLGVFGSVDVQPDLHDPGEERVPIRVILEPSQLRAVRVGGGLELDVIKTDFHLAFGWEDRNFLGGLRRLSADFRPGVVAYPTHLPDLQLPSRLLPEERFVTEFHQPGLLEARTNGLLRGEVNVTPVILTPDINPGDPVLGYRELRGATGFDRTLWKLYVSLTYNAQVDFPFAYVGAIDPTLQSAVVSYVDLLTRLDFRNNGIHPRSGFLLGNDLQVAGGVLGGDAEDLRIQPEARAYFPISRRVTLAARGSVGLLFPLNYGNTLRTDTAAGTAPPDVSKQEWDRDVQLAYLRAFFAGGPISNRGWPLRGIGPQGIAPFFSPQIAALQVAQSCTPNSPTYDEVRCGVPLGGLSLWEASVELRFATQSPLEVATFCDAADVSPGRVNLRFARPHLSCGFGVRYDTPVGAVRLDLAYRIPGLQTLEPSTPGDDTVPGTIFGLPVAVAFGIGEAY